jgi:hypothetical protein
LFLYNRETAGRINETFPILTWPSQPSRVVEANRVLRIGDGLTWDRVYWGYLWDREFSMFAVQITAGVLAFWGYADSEDRLQWLRRARRFPSIGAALGIGMVGAATTLSMVYVLENNDELFRDRLGFSPYLRDMRNTCCHLYFSKVDSYRHRLDAGYHQFIQREKWIYCLNQVVMTGSIAIYLALIARWSPIYLVVVGGGGHVGLPLYYHNYPSDAAKEADDRDPPYLPIQEAFCVTVSTVAYLVTGRLAVPIFILAATEAFEHALIYPATLPFSIAFTSSFHRRGGHVSSHIPAAAEEEKGKE